jgi:hypothetical protein
MLALSGEELCPGNNLGVLLEERAALPFGHPAPHTELDPVVQRIGAALGDHRAVATDDGRLALGCAADEQLVGIRGSTQCLRNPCDSGLSGSALDGGR